MTSCILCMLCAGCGSVMEYEGTGDGANGAANEVYSSYLALSRTETVSALDVALGKVPETDAEGKICGLTEADVEYIASLSSDSLLSLKTEIMKRWGIESDEEIENTLDHAYEAFTADMDADNMSKFNIFLKNYIEVSDRELAKDCLLSATNNIPADYLNTYIYAALGIDRFGRVAYEPFVNTRSSEECGAYLTIRLAIASLAVAASPFTGGFTGLVAASAIGDAIQGYLMYRLCRRTRSE